MKYKVTKRLNNSWSGITTFNNTTLRFTPSISTETRRLKTGLIRDTEKGIDEFAEFEKKLGLDKGALTDTIRSNGELVSEFWRDYGLEIPGKGVDLDDENPMEELHIKVLKASSLVCKRGERSSKATLELYNEEETANTSNNIRKIRTKAYATYSKMSSADKLNYIIAKGLRPTSTSESVIDDLVGRDVETNPEAFLDFISDDFYKDKVKLYKFVEAGVIRKSKNLFIYRDTHIGASEQLAIEFLKRPSNQQIYEGIVTEYKRISEKASNVEVPLQDMDDEKENIPDENKVSTAQSKKKESLKTA